jgi:predicted outer membrane repeat protein
MNADSNLTFVNSIFDDNSTGGIDKSGGGLFFSEGNVTITNSIFKNNLARGNGGAISGSGDGTLTITGSLFLNNTAANINLTFGNGDRANGGAINVFGDGRKVLMSKNTFYNNEATFQGGGIYFGGSNASSNLENITVFGNKVNLTSAEKGKGGGIRIEGNKVFVIKNSLIYGNLLGNTINPQSDINIGSKVQLNFINSLSGISDGFEADDTYDSSKIDAILASSNLRFNETSGKVEYDEAPKGDDTPVDFGTDGNDAGAWNSMFVLSLNESEVSDEKFSIYYNKTIKNIQIITSFNSLMKVTIYNINGSQVVLKNQMDSKDKIDISSFESGVYILKANIEGKYFLRKFILY